MDESATSKKDVTALQATSALTRIQGIVNDGVKLNQIAQMKPMLSRFRNFHNRAGLSYIQIEDVGIPEAETFRDYLKEVKK